MKKITDKQRKYGKKFCQFCKPDKVPAIWIDWYSVLACDKHTDRLHEDDNHMTEGDYQSWGSIK